MPATLKSRIPQIIAGMDPGVNAAIKAGAEVISERAKTLAPDAPPQGEGLVEAIHVEDAGDGGQYVVAGDSEHFYGHFLEFGTVKAPAQPFLIPAAEASVTEIEGLVNAALRTL
jgi:HK97 gp10 family phage protein